jgi:hypothetical protein
MMSSHVWHDVAPALARTGRFEVFAPTMAGHNGGPHTRSWFLDTKTLADHVEAQLDELGWGSAHIVGNSLGGWVAFELERRGRARTLTAIAPAGGWQRWSPIKYEIVGKFVAGLPVWLIAMVFGRRAARLPLVETSLATVTLAGTTTETSGACEARPATAVSASLRWVRNQTPTSASKARPQGGMALDQVAIGQVASQPSTNCKGCKAQAAASHAAGTPTPSMASGVTTNVTQGMASKLASKPTKETCPKNNNPSGAKATVTMSCSRSNAPARLNTTLAQTGCFSPGSHAWPVAIKIPTATKLSQKPGCNMAQGSHVSTTAPAKAQTKCPGQSRADSLSSTTTANIHIVRCAGTPQPLNKA